MATRGLDLPVAASRPRSTSAICGRDSPAPTSAPGPGTLESLPTSRGGGPYTPIRDTGPARLAPRGDPGLLDRVPRRHGREHRPALDRRGPAGHAHRDAGRPDVRHVRVSRVAGPPPPAPPAAPP